MIKFYAPYTTGIHLLITSVLYIWQGLYQYLKLKFQIVALYCILRIEMIKLIYKNIAAYEYS